MKSTKINYDPHHIISQRRQYNKNKVFDHEEIEGLTQRYNLMEYPSDVDNSKSLHVDPSSKIKSKSMIVPNYTKVEIRSKKSFSKMVEIED